MQQQKIATLRTIFSEVLADLAFMFTEEKPAEPAAHYDWLETRIGYRGPDCGNLRFRCPEQFCVQLAANLLGIDPNDGDAADVSHDAAKEFMNVVCGHFVTTMYGTEKVFNLTIPETRPMAEPPNLWVKNEERISTVAVDGFPIQLEYQECDPSDACE